MTQIGIPINNKRTRTMFKEVITRDTPAFKGQVGSFQYVPYQPLRNQQQQSQQYFQQMLPQQTNQVLNVSVQEPSYVQQYQNNQFPDYQTTQKQLQNILPYQITSQVLPQQVALPAFIPQFGQNIPPFQLQNQPENVQLLRSQIQQDHIQREVINDVTLISQLEDDNGKPFQNTRNQVQPMKIYKVDPPFSRQQPKICSPIPQNQANDSVLSHVSQQSYTPSLRPLTECESVRQRSPQELKSEEKQKQKEIKRQFKLQNQIEELKETITNQAQLISRLVVQQERQQEYVAKKLKNLKRQEQLNASKRINDGHIIPTDLLRCASLVPHASKEYPIVPKLELNGPNAVVKEIVMLRNATQHFPMDQMEAILMKDLEQRQQNEEANDDWLQE